MIIIFLFPHLLWAQGLFNFEIDSNSAGESCPGSGWEQVPEGAWACSGEEAIAGGFSLKHVFDHQERACDYLIYSHREIDPRDSLVLSFRIRHSYPPSSANNWQLALASEFSHEQGQIRRGIVLGVNFVGSNDLVSLWSVEQGEVEELGVSDLNYQEEIGIWDAPAFRLVWHPGGTLSLFWAPDPDQEQVRIASCEVEQLPQGKQLVLRYACTSTRDRGLWLDDLLLAGRFLSDTLPPVPRKEPVWGDVVFSEVMADPEPQVLLEGEEYLELFNRSEDSLDLSRWVLHVNHRIFERLEFYKWSPSGLTPASSWLMPGSYLVLKGLALPNQGATLALYSEGEILVHGSSYQPPWDGADWKKEGGWSLESSDPDHLCLLWDGWAYSVDPSGGTPGRSNSHYTKREDREPPVLLFYGYESPEVLKLTYSEAIDPDLLDPRNFILRPGTVFPAEVELQKPLSRQLILSFPANLQERQQFKLDLPVVTDCWGNQAQKETLRGGRIQAPEAGDLFINEIMFNPLEGDPEFVELYNPGPGFYDLRYLSLQVGDPGETPGRPLALSESSRIFLPGEYLVLASSVPHLLEAYGLEPSGRWLGLATMPTLKNGGGSLWLTDRSGGLVDQVNYSETQHMSLLVDSKGVSLERISTERPGMDSTNWHSAASIAGYATPGERNSQAGELPLQEELLHVEPRVFSPDNDGFQDQLKIRVSPQSGEWILRLWISDLAGVPVRILANNHLAAPSLVYSWDGESEGGKMVSEGIYVIHLLAFHPDSGARRSSKAAIGVIYR